MRLALKLSKKLWTFTGGSNTGVKEAVSAGKYLGQLLEHLGSSVLVEWYWRGISQRLAGIFQHRNRGISAGAAMTRNYAK